MAYLDNDGYGGSGFGTGERPERRPPHLREAAGAEITLISTRGGSDKKYRHGFLTGLVKLK